METEAKKVTLPQLAEVDDEEEEVKEGGGKAGRVRMCHVGRVRKVKDEMKKSWSFLLDRSSEP